MKAPARRSTPRKKSCDPPYAVDQLYRVLALDPPTHLLPLVRVVFN